MNNIIHETISEERNSWVVSSLETINRKEDCIVCHWEKQLPLGLKKCLPIQQRRYKRIREEIAGFFSF